MKLFMALDNMFKICEFIKDDISPEYNTFKEAFGISSSEDILVEEPN